MPILLWIAFWSSMTGVAKGWQETYLANPREGDGPPRSIE